LGFLLLLLDLLLLLPLTPGGALADADAHDGELERWVFSTALEVGVFGHTGKGNASGTPLGLPQLPRPNTGVPCPNSSACLDYVIGDDRDVNVIREKASREDILSALVGGNFEIMSPALFDVPTRPRLFLDVSIAAVLATEVGLAREADPSVMGYPLIFPITENIGETTVFGRGNKITVQQQGPQVHAGLGAAFTFDFGPERIRLKPSLAYSRIIVDISAKARRAVRYAGYDTGDPGPGEEPNPRVFDLEFRSIVLDDQVTEVYHGLGPALEIEYETRNRVGPFAVSLFAKGNASYLFGDLKTEMQRTNQDPDVYQLNDMGEQVPIDESVNWKYTQDRWVYRVTTGIRFRLVPKRKR